MLRLFKQFRDLERRVEDLEYTTSKQSKRIRELETPYKYQLNDIVCDYYIMNRWRTCKLNNPVNLYEVNNVKNKQISIFEESYIDGLVKVAQHLGNNI